LVAALMMFGTLRGRACQFVREVSTTITRLRVGVGNDYATVGAIRVPADRQTVSVRSARDQVSRR
jgi:hypothetical protein